MKARTVLLLILMLGIISVVVVQRRREAAAVSPNAVVNMVADAQRDTFRAPLQLTRLSDEEETRIGDEMANRYLSAYNSVDDKSDEVTQIVQRVGKRLAAHAHRHLQYRFHLLPNRSMLNAFALPGGHVFIGLGLIDLMDTEDELANVLGHELEHIDHYHCVERVQVEAQMRKLQLGSFGDLVQLPLTIFEAGYSKDQEAEADREGLLLAVAGGYSPYGAVDMFEKFAKLYRDQTRQAASPPEELSQLALETLLGYFRSHPLPQERVAEAREVIREHRLTSLTAQTPLNRPKD